MMLSRVMPCKGSRGWEAGDGMALFSKAMESDHGVFLGFIQLEAGFLDFPGNPRHVGHPPRHHDVVRLRKLGLDFFQEMLVPLREEILKETGL
jgi:hypothetical protein